MSERFRYRGTPQDPNDWFSPFAKSRPEDELARRLGGADRTRGDIFIKATPPTPETFGIENLGFIPVDKEIANRMNTVANGTKKQGGAAQKYLIDRAAHGTTEDLLDIVNAAVVSGLMLKTTDVGILKRVGVSPQRTIDAVKNVNRFTGDLMKALKAESRNYVYLPDRRSEATKVKVADSAFDLLVSTTADSASLPNGLLEFAGMIEVHAKGTIDPNIKRFVMYVEPDLSDAEIEELRSYSSAVVSDRRRLLTLKASMSSAATINRDALITAFFQEMGDEGILNSLAFFQISLNSSNTLVRNLAIRALIIDGRGHEFEQTRINWARNIQTVLGKIADGDETLDEDLKGEVLAVLSSIALIPSGPLDLSTFLRDYDTRTDFFNNELVQKFINSEQQNPVIDLLVLAYRESLANTISEGTFSEMFDERRPLGYFLDNLNAQWQDLKRITRDKMWPSFITARQAKIWPSERELNILSFSRRHPAEVLGFQGIEFFTRGYLSPRVGLEFTFKGTDKVLRGRLHSNGRLVGLPFDIEETQPHIHAFLEHIAVGSFQELVTIAERRIVEKGHEARGKKVDPEVHTNDVVTYTSSVPRRETSYITVTRHFEPETVGSDDVIEEASERERLPKLIPQRVIPLAYSQRYRYLLGLLQIAQENDAPASELMDLEGQMLLAFSLIPKPSAGKLDNLPEQFQLEQTPDSKFMETWRVEHFRPKPKEGEEPNLPEIFERRFRAAPIALTKHLETWFTQPPK